jgi:hypothetical protein
MHHALVDRYLWRARAAELVILGASVVFCATSFAGESLFSGLGLDPATARLALGIASVAAFFASLVLMVVDWKGAAARHQDAAIRWTGVVQRFLENQLEDGSWPEGLGDELSRSYWEAGKNSVSVPDGRFNALKSQYLIKSEVSRLVSSYPGSPRFWLWVVVRVRGVWRSLT